MIIGGSLIGRLAVGSDRKWRWGKAVGGENPPGGLKCPAGGNQSGLLHRSEFEDVFRAFDQLFALEGFDDVILDAHFNDLHDIFLA
jgi:hypothetical protein